MSRAAGSRLFAQSRAVQCVLHWVHTASVSTGRGGRGIGPSEALVVPVHDIVSCDPFTGMCAALATGNSAARWRLAREGGR